MAAANASGARNLRTHGIEMLVVPDRLPAPPRRLATLSEPPFPCIFWTRLFVQIKVSVDNPRLRVVAVDVHGAVERSVEVVAENWRGVFLCGGKWVWGDSRVV